MRFGHILLLAAAVAVVSSARADTRRIRIAVLDIRALASDAQKAELLSEIALTEAASVRELEVIGKSDINAVIGFEKQKQVMGCGEDSTCLAEIGGALGVDYILIGSLGTLGDLFRLDMKLVDTRKARVRGRVGTTVEGSESKLVAAVTKGVHDLLAPIVPGAAGIAAAAPAKAPASLGASPRAAGIAPSSAPPPSGVSTSAPPGSDRRTWAYVSAGAGLALLAGGAVAGLQARSAFDSEKKAAAANDTAAYDSSKSKARSMAMLADALFVGAAAGVGVGAWLFFTTGSRPLALEVSPVSGGALASISGGF